MTKWNLKCFWNIWTSWILCQKVKLVPKWQIMDRTRKLRTGRGPRKFNDSRTGPTGSHDKIIFLILFWWLPLILNKHEKKTVPTVPVPKNSTGTEKPFQVGTGTEKPYRLSTKSVLELKNSSKFVPSWYWYWKTVPKPYQQFRYCFFGTGTIVHGVKFKTLIYV